MNTLKNKNMKYLNKLLIIALLLTFTACDFLDVVPDETGTEEDAFKDPRAAERFLYSCYSFLPNPREGAGSLDLYSGDEVVTAFEHELFANFPKGNFTANNPVISYWNTLFGGIKQCYILKNNIDGVPLLSDSEKKDYAAQADFLIAYYHYLLLRCYGPIILVKEEPLITTPAEEYLARSSYDECVAWISDKFDEAAANLPESRSGKHFGFATSLAAKGIKSRMHLFAASPLFNGNSKFYSDFKDIEGNPLISQTYDAKKWLTAVEASKAAIDAAERAGYRLFKANDVSDQTLTEPSDPIQRALRFTIVDRTSKELIWTDTRHEGYYSIQNKSRPYWTGAAWNGVGPTLTMLDRFYTKNGLPIDEDPEFDYNDRFSIAEFAEDDINGEGPTSKMNIDREPRYYAWISFHGGYYECQGETSGNGAERWAYLPQYKRGLNDMKVATFFTKYDNCGKHDRSNNYSPAGFLNKKGVHPKTIVSESGSSITNYPWPIVRLAELYLNYAEACVEANNLTEAKKYIDLVRERAGVPSLDKAWGSIGVTLTQDKLREVVRQERLVELYLEGHNFWDMRRWLWAGEFFDATPQGLSVDATDLATFSQRKDLSIVRNFTSPTHYLLPIPYGETQRNKNLVQNPGY